MNGKALVYNSAEMNNVLVYMHWLSGDVPTGVSVKGRGFGPIDKALVPDASRGKDVYATNCASCHGPDEHGVKNADGGYAFSPLSENDSFNDGAGVARTFTAAAFAKHNMPLGKVEA